MTLKLTTIIPFEPGPYSLVGGPLCGVKAPGMLKGCWEVLMSHETDVSQFYAYERRTPNDPHFYYRGLTKPRDGNKA